MKKDNTEDQWKKIKGKIKDQLGIFTADELKAISNGRREQFSILIQQRYNITKEEAEKKFDEIKRQYGSEQSENADLQDL